MIAVIAFQCPCSSQQKLYFMKVCRVALDSLMSIHSGLLPRNTVVANVSSWTIMHTLEGEATSRVEAAPLSFSASTTQCDSVDGIPLHDILGGFNACACRCVHANQHCGMHASIRAIASQVSADVKCSGCVRVHVRRHRIRIDASLIYIQEYAKRILQRRTSHSFFLMWTSSHTAVAGGRPGPPAAIYLSVCLPWNDRAIALRCCPSVIRHLACLKMLVTLVLQGLFPSVQLLNCVNLGPMCKLATRSF